MSALSNFLRDVGKGLLGEGGPNLKDYQHADRLYNGNNYARSPKFGFLYYVNFNINAVPLDKDWQKRKKQDIGILCKEVDLPRFQVSVDTLNQYNRKTLVQKKITYQPVSFTFHDDNSDTTTDLWKNYYQYYYTDSIYGTVKKPNPDGTGGSKLVDAYSDVKLSDKSYYYGYNPYSKDYHSFFNSIDIFLLHKGHGSSGFSQITLVNPMIQDWSHDKLSYDEGNKTLVNKMTVMYEMVYYARGKIKKDNPAGFPGAYYDTDPSPIRIGGSGSIFGPGGILSGFNDIFGSDGTANNINSFGDFLGVGLQTVALVKNLGNVLHPQSPTSSYSLVDSVLRNSVNSTLRPAVSNNTAQGNNGISFFPNNQTQSTIAGSASSIVGKSKGGP